MWRRKQKYRKLRKARFQRLILDTSRVSREVHFPQSRIEIEEASTPVSVLRTPSASGIRQYPRRKPIVRFAWRPESSFHSSTSLSHPRLRWLVRTALSRLPTILSSTLRQDLERQAPYPGAHNPGVGNASRTRRASQDFSWSVRPQLCDQNHELLRTNREQMKLRRLNAHVSGFMPTTLNYGAGMRLG